MSRKSSGEGKSRTRSIWQLATGISFSLLSNVITAGSLIFVEPSLNPIGWKIQNY